MADSYTSSLSTRREVFQRKGISPPPRDSGTRLFTSNRKFRPMPRNSGTAGPGAIMKQEHRARQRQTRSKTRLVEHLAAMNLDKPDAPLNAPTGPLRYRLEKERSGTDAMDSDLPAALRAPFKHYISNEPCRESFCPVTALVSHTSNNLL